MKGFTFVVFTYNQEEYIIEHLESVKKQITCYGSNYANTIIICDDCSKDRTTEFAKKWLEYNRDIGYEYRIIKQQRNVGIVKNYLSALHSVETNLFSIIAGDDMYYDNSVYAAAEQSNFVYTPRISFDSQGNIHGEKLWLFKKCLITKKTSKYVMEEMMKYRMVIDVMSVKWRKEFCSRSFYDEISQYDWVEDYPTMHNILNNPKLEVTLYHNPIILYRDDSGISQKKTHTKKSLYNDDQMKVFKDYNLKTKRYPKYVNLYNYYFVMIKIVDYLRFFFNKKIRNFEEEYNKECLKADLYLNDIKKDAKIFRNMFSLS